MASPFNASKFRASPANQKLDVFGGGHTPDSEPMQWQSTWVSNPEKNGKGWTVLGKKDGSLGAFGILDISEDHHHQEGCKRYNVAYYPDLNLRETCEYYRKETDPVDAEIVRHYFDIFEEIQLGIWKACMEEKRNFHN